MPEDPESKIPKSIEMVPVRRGVELVSLAYDDEGRVVASYFCDCGTATDLVFEDAVKLRSGVHETAFTCDCLTSHWVRFEITGVATDG